MADTLMTTCVLYPTTRPNSGALQLVFPPGPVGNYTTLPLSFSVYHPPPTREKRVESKFCPINMSSLLYVINHEFSNVGRVKSPVMLEKTIVVGCSFRFALGGFRGELRVLLCSRDSPRRINPIEITISGTNFIL